jgi:bifunctional DNA-binding transcriptional regulator/antitoxin component of YhaV-PrlF toxin-antitoxin module
MEKSTKFTAIVNKNNAIVIPKTARLKTGIGSGTMIDVCVEVVARSGGSNDRQI